MAKKKTVRVKRSPETTAAIAESQAGSPFGTIAVSWTGKLRSSPDGAQDPNGFQRFEAGFRSGRERGMLDALNALARQCAREGIMPIIEDEILAEAKKNFDSETKFKRERDTEERLRRIESALEKIAATHTTA